MTNQVNVHEAKTRLSELLVRVEAGEEIVVARSGRPIARLVPLEDVPARQLGFVPGGPVRVSFFEELPGDELGAWGGA